MMAQCTSAAVGAASVVAAEAGAGQAGAAAMAEAGAGAAMVVVVVACAAGAAEVTEVVAMGWQRWVTTAAARAASALITTAGATSDCWRG